MTQIELTQEELDLIQAKRDQEAAKEQQKQDKIQADIVKGKANIARRQEEDRKQNAAARAFQKELGEGWEERTREEERTEKVYWGMDVVWRETYTDCRVYLEKGKYKVHVNMHTVYNGWRGGADKGYKMFVSGPNIEYGYSQKALSKAATVNKKVQDCIDTIKAVEEAKKKKLSAVETAVQDLKMKFPEAVVTSFKDWTRGYSNKNPYREFDKIVVKLPNGIEINYEVYSDGRLNRLSVLFSCQDEIALIGALGAIELPSTTK
jgi:hypothetical protein